MTHGIAAASVLSKSGPAPLTEEGRYFNNARGVSLSLHAAPTSRRAGRPVGYQGIVTNNENEGQILGIKYTHCTKHAVDMGYFLISLPNQVTMLLVMCTIPVVSNITVWEVTGHALEKRHSLPSQSSAMLLSGRLCYVHMWW